MRVASYNQHAPIELYVPPILRSVAIAPTECTLAAEYDAKLNVTHFTYTLCWEEERNTIEQAKAVGHSLIPSSSLSSVTGNTSLYRKVGRSSSSATCAGAPTVVSSVSRGSSSMTSQSTRASSPNVVRLSDIERYLNEEEEVVNKTNKSEEGGVRCDGPCRKKVKPNELHELGRCGHNLCDGCNSMVMNKDGTDGCSAYSCFRTSFHFLSDDQAKRAYEHLMVGKRDKMNEARNTHSNQVFPQKEAQQPTAASASTNTSASTHSSTQTPSQTRSSERSGISSHSVGNGTRPSTLDSSVRIPTGQNEMICARVMVLQPGYVGTIKRTHFEREVLATDTLLMTIKKTIPESILEVSAKKDLKGRVYYIRSTRKGPQQIPNENLHQRYIYELPAKNAVLNIVVDFTNTVNQDYRHEESD